jgi:hypothetical protein
MPLPWMPQFWLYFYTFFKEPLDISRLDSTNGLASPPFVPREAGAKSDAALRGRSRVGRSSPSYRTTQVPLSLSHQSRPEIAPWHKASGRNSSTLPGRATHARGRNLWSSLEGAAQSICGSHDSSSLTLGKWTRSLSSLDSLHTHQGTLTTEPTDILPSFGPSSK